MHFGKIRREMEFMGVVRAVWSLRGAVSSRGVLTLRGFRLLRIMSFLHLERSYQAMKNLREIFALKKEELGVVSYLTIVIVLTSSTTM